MRILSLAPLAGPGLETMRSLGEIEVDPWNAHVPIKLHAVPELIERLQGVDVLIVEADFIPAEVLDAVSLRALGVCRGDPNNVDVEAATRNGVVVIRTPGRNADAVADLALALMLVLLRSIVVADDDIRAGRWVVDGKIAQQRYLGREIASCRVGLIGCGAVGRATAKRLLALDAAVAAFDPGVAPEELRAAGIEPVAALPDLMGSCDILSVHAPLIDATRGMLDAAAFGAVRHGTLFVNTARYGVAEEGALLDALRDGRLGAGAFDHFHNEFLPPDHPLLSMTNVVLTPHIGGSTIETIENHTRQIAAGIAAVLAGRATPELVNPAVLGARKP